MVFFLFCIFAALALEAFLKAGRLFELLSYTAYYPLVSQERGKLVISYLVRDFEVVRPVIGLVYKELVVGPNNGEKLSNNRFLHGLPRILIDLLMLCLVLKYHPREFHSLPQVIIEYSI